MTGEQPNGHLRYVMGLLVWHSFKVCLVCHRPQLKKVEIITFLARMTETFGILIETFYLTKLGSCCFPNPQHKPQPPFYWYLECLHPKPNYESNLSKKTLVSIDKLSCPNIKHVQIIKTCSNTLHSIGLILMDNSRYDIVI